MRTASLLSGKLRRRRLHPNVFAAHYAGIRGSPKRQCSATGVDHNVRMTVTILVTGDRNWSRSGSQVMIIREALRGYRKHNPVIVHGAARGVDSIAGDCALALGYTVHPHPANWSEYHRAAGPIRNTEMLQEKPDLVLAFHDDLLSSKGTRNMVNQAVKAGIPVILHDSHGKRTVVKEQV